MADFDYLPERYHVELAMLSAGEVPRAGAADNLWKCTDCGGALPHFRKGPSRARCRPGCGAGRFATIPLPHELDSEGNWTPPEGCHEPETYDD